MPEARTAGECSSEKSVPDDVEKEIVSAGTTYNIEDRDINPAPQASGDRALELMDIENGMVGWESVDDPDNPQ